MTNRAECITAQNAEKGEKTMNNELFTELDNLTDSTNNIDFTMLDIGIEINSTSDYEVEKFKE